MAATYILGPFRLDAETDTLFRGIPALQLEPLALTPSNIHPIVRTRPQPLSPRVTADDRNARRAFGQ
jgi:hypothetical protein